MTNTVSPSSIGTGLMSRRTKSDPAWALWAETLAPYEAILNSFTAHAHPTCRATFSQWWRAANPGGFSAKMFLHLTLWSSPGRFTCSDTLSVLSRATVPRSPARAGVGSSWRGSIVPEPASDSYCWLSEKAVRGLARRMHRRKAPLRVLLRDANGGIQLTILRSVKKGTVYDIYAMKSGRRCKVGLAASLAAYLTACANESSVTESPHPSPSGSADE